MEVTLKTGVKLGTTANLTLGYKPIWEAPDPEGSPLFAPQQQVLPEIDPIIEVDEDLFEHWDEIYITLHYTSESLVSSLFPYIVLPESGRGPAANYPAGPLTIADKDRDAALEALKDKLGVDVSNPDYGYALVRFWRRAGEVSHPNRRFGMFVPSEVEVPQSFESALSKLRHDRRAIGGGQKGNRPNQKTGLSKNRYNRIGLPRQEVRLSEQNIASYLEAFKQYGTHCVTKVFAGDTIYQVFAYPRERFEKLREYYPEDQIEGPDVIYFRQYTTHVEAGANGFVAEYGQILSTSNDPLVAKSVSDGKWHEKTYAKTDSVFATFDSDRDTISFATMQAEFVQIVPIGFELSPIDRFAEYFRAQVWKRIFKAVMYQKYGDAIAPGFAPLPDLPDFNEIFPEDHEGFLSAIATPTIDTYKTRLDLGEVTLVAEEEVKHFNVATQVLQLSGQEEHSIPGEEVVFLTHIVDAAPNEGKIPKIKLSDEGHSNVVLACQDFFGAVGLTNASRTQWNAIVDGFMYGSIDSDTYSDRYEVIVDRDVCTAPSEEVLVANLHNLEFSLVTADIVISSGGADGREIAKRYLEWLGEIIPDDTENEALQEFQMRVLEQARVAQNLADHAYVPILEHTEYNKEVEAILNLLDAIEREIVNQQNEIKLRKLAELTADIGNALNENIIQTGNLLMQIIKANAAQQESMARYYDGLIERSEGELVAQKEKMDELNQLVREQKKTVEKAVDNYKRALQDWATRQMIKFALELALGFLTVGFAVAIPADAIDSVRSLGKTAQKVQKALNVLDSVFKVYETGSSGKDDIETARKALKDLDSLGIEFPSVREWEEMELHMQATLDTAPDVGAAKEELRKEFGILAIRGKTQIEAQTNAQQTARDIYFWEKQRQVYREHQQRLEEMDGQFDPENINDLDRSKVDLVGLTGELLFVQRRMLSQLAKAFVRKDRALQYETLQPPTAVSSFSLLKFRSAIVTQTQAETTARAKLAGLDKSDPTITYEIKGVGVEQISGGHVFQAPIYSDASQFQDYVKVRLNTLVVRVKGIDSTASGKYYVEVFYEGMPFFDRDTERQPLQYYTDSRQRYYEYEAGTDKPNFGDDGIDWSTGVNPVTPFSTWQISLPPVQANQDIVFKGPTVDIELEFKLDVVINPIEQWQQRRLARLGATSTFQGTATAPDLGDMLDKMYSQGSTVKGWDVVFSMQEDKINTVLEEQFEEFQENPDFQNEIFVLSCSPYPGVLMISLFELTYSYPKLSFDNSGSKKAHVTIPLLKAKQRKCTGNGSYECDDLGDVDWENPDDDDRILGCNPWEDLKTEAGETPYLTSDIDIEKMAGIVQPEEGDAENVLSVVLDLKKGSFEIADIELPPEVGDDLSDAIKRHFEKNDVKFVINSLDLNDINVIPALTPSSFNFRSLKTYKEKKMLQLFITTDGEERSEMSLNNVPEPIPDGSECSIIISSRILFDQIMPESFEQSSNFGLEGINPGDIHKAWSAIINSGQITGRFPDIKDMWLEGGNTIRWNLSSNDGMMFERTAMEGIHLTYTGNRDDLVVVKRYWRYIPGIPGGGRWEYEYYEAEAVLNVDSTLSIAIIGSGRNQEVKIDSNPADITMDGSLEVPSDCNNLQQQYRDELQKQVPSQITEQVNVSFSGVSLFAIKNLLFPTENYIDLKSAYSPGDLLILGTFVKEES